VAQKPHDAVVNFLSKFTAASRGPPCDSTALVIITGERPALLQQPVTVTSTLVSVQWCIT